MSPQDLEKLVHAFILSRLDHCNGIFTSLPKKSVRQLQLIQMAAAVFLRRLVLLLYFVLMSFMLSVKHLNCLVAEMC